ncbi:hypothetical protein ACFL1R_04605 [Candidatus Latescibacterota bacterium]
MFPGLGQVILKHYKRGAVLMLVVSASMLVILIKALKQAIAIMEKVVLEGSVINMSTISNAATQAATTFDSPILKLLLLLIIFCWIIGIVDAYRIGRKKDLESRLASQASNGNDRC